MTDEILTKSLEEIQKAKLALVHAEYNLDIYEYSVKICKENLMNVVSRRPQYLAILFDLSDDARKWLNKLETEKIDKRRKYNEKFCYDLFLDKLKEFFNENDICIKKIYDDGFTAGKLGISVKFESHGNIFDLFIPNLRLLHIKFFDNVCKEGKLSLSIFDGKIYHVLCQSYDEEEILKAFQNKIQELVKTV